MKESAVEDLLYVYDNSDSIDRSQEAGRFSGPIEGRSHHTISVGSVAELQKALDQLVADGKTFRNGLFQTHGNAGMIFFAKEALDAKRLKSRLRGRGYPALFPGVTRLGFDGCNVAEGGDGTDFLIAAAEIFLRHRGSVAFGYTTLGHGVPGWLPLIGGHTLHFGGKIKNVNIT
jgi:hypothetical protein